MKDIKTRDTAKDIRMLDRTKNVADRMKNVYVRTKEQAGQTHQANVDSPVGYAENRATESAQSATHEAGYMLYHHEKRLSNKTRKKIKDRPTREDTTDPEQPEAKGKSPKAQKKKATTSKASTSSYEPHASESKPPDYAIQKRDFTRDSTRWRTERTASNYAGREKWQIVKTVDRGMNQSAHASKKTIKTSARGSIKTVKHGVKTAEQTSRTAIKATQTTAKVAAKTAQATARSTQRAAQAAKVTAKVAATVVKTTSQAIVSAVKTLITAVKSIVAAIAAGGWVAVVVIVVVLLSASILGSVFGLFASEDGYDSAPSMPEVVRQTNAAFSAELDAIIQNTPHDRLVIDNAGTASIIANWDEVLAIYAVLVSTDPDNPTEVATLDDTKIEKLKTVFWDMNHISYSVDEVEVGTNEDTGYPITETVLTITVSNETAEDMISYYGFSSERAAKVRELLLREYAELFMRLTGSYVDIPLSAAVIGAIMETLPDGLSEAVYPAKRKQLDR